MLPLYFQLIWSCWYYAHKNTFKGQSRVELPTNLLNAEFHECIRLRSKEKKLSPHQNIRSPKGYYINSD